jgi:hypothetical protein
MDRVSCANALAIICLRTGLNAWQTAARCNVTDERVIELTAKTLKGEIHSDTEALGFLEGEVQS